MKKPLSKYNLFFFDLDGTLLNDRKLISDLNKKALLDLQEKGKYCCIATGRSALNNAMHYAKQVIHPKLKKPTYLIVLNGAEIIDVNSNSIIYNNFIDSVHGHKLLSYMQKVGWLTIVYSDVVTIVNKRNIIAKSIINKEITNNLGYSKTMDVSKPIKKITAHILTKFEEHVDDLIHRFGDHIQVVKHGTRKFYQVIEITANNISKKTAAEIVASYYDTTLHNSVAFGDSFNDLDLLKNAGYSVTFADSLPAIKKECDYISTSSDDSGVGQAIYQLFL